MDLLSTGISRTQRDVKYYADRLHVSPKYLSATIKRVTGLNVLSYINRYTVPILKNTWTTSGCRSRRSRR